MRRPVSVLYTAAQIGERVHALAEEIAGNVPPNVMVVALLRGSFVFAADLIRALHAQHMQPQIDFLTLSSYGKEKFSSGQVTLHSDLASAVEGRDVLIIDDILESGRTLHEARRLILERGAGNVKIAVLLEKPGKRAVDLQADFIGFTVADQFVVGYGLDDANYYRELPFIGVVDGES